MVHSGQFFIVNASILSCEHRWASRQQTSPTDGLFNLLTWRVRTIGQPPEQHDAQDDCQQAVDQEHPLEAYETTESIHLLEPGTDKTNDSGRKLRSGIVMTNTFRTARRWVIQTEIVCHAGPHTSNDNTQQQA